MPSRRGDMGEQPNKQRNRQQESQNQSGTYPASQYYDPSDNRGPYYLRQDREYTTDRIPSGYARDESNLREIPSAFADRPAWPTSGSSSPGWSNGGMDVNLFNGVEHQTSSYTSPLPTGHHTYIESNPQSSYSIPQGQDASADTLAMYDNNQYPGWNNQDYSAVGQPQNIGQVPMQMIQGERVGPDENEPASNMYIPVMNEAHADSPSPLHGHMQDLSLEGNHADNSPLISCPNDCGKEFHGQYARGNLKRHLKTCPKSGQTKQQVPCRVPGCDKAYGRSDAVKVHVNRHHSGYSGPQ